ncbi:RNA-binding cell elongation regulator Jag/EloR [Streptococcus sp. zg-JUN1979]|uniref:RNA-binding cell elongation regulator Jag/EloR n=1 Tax=Streptococcus sp. zg-JUN1979 TaxID=3391450 RepID=UPI0039A5B22C
MVVFTGKTVEEAIATGLETLGLTRLKARIKVISREKNGFLGIGRKPAQVDIEVLDKVVHEETMPQTHKKVTSIAEHLPRESASQSETMTVVDASLEPLAFNPEDVSERDDLVVKPVVFETKQSDAKNSSETGDVDQDDQETARKEDTVVSEVSPSSGSQDSIEEAAEEVRAYVDNILYEMDLEATIEVTYKRRQISLQIETTEPGRVIGYHGKVLKSLQLLAQNFLYDRYSKSFSVSVNVHDYVEQRTETLIEFSKKIAHRVLETGEDFIMDPMTNSERKIVHKAIAHVDGVKSYSQGNDPNRYVVVSVK